MKRNISVIIFLCIFLITIVPVYATDSELTRRTLKGVSGVNLLVEDFQPNIQKYAQKSGLNKEALQKEIVKRFESAGIEILSWDDWLKTLGRPLFYINVNTHEYEKYRYAFDIRIELRQMVILERNPSIKTLATTWSTNMTGTANIGSLNTIAVNTERLVDRFIDAWKKANKP